MVFGNKRSVIMEEYFIDDGREVTLLVSGEIISLRAIVWPQLKSSRTDRQTDRQSSRETD